MENAPQAPTTTLQADIIQKTAAAVQDTGFDAGFDQEVDAAIARDSNATAVKEGKIPAPEPKVEAKADPKPEPKAKAEKPALDIPDLLLTKNEPQPIKDVPGAEARQKEIEENVKGMSPKAADRFRALEAKKHEAEQKAARVADLERKLVDAETRAKAQVDASETEALKKHIEELDAIVQRNALTEHPKFRAAFDAKIETEVAAVSKLLSKEAAAEAQALLSLPETAQRNKRLNEIAQELEPLEANKLHAAIDRVDRLNAERSNELQNWKLNKQRMSEMSQAEQNQTKEQRQRLIDTAYKSVETKFSDPEKGVELFRKVDGNEEWNKSVDERLAHVRKLTEAELRPDDIAEMAAWAMSGNEYRKLFLSQRVLVKRLQEEIASLKGGEPGLGESGGHEAGDDESGGMVDVVARAAQRSGAVR